MGIHAEGISKGNLAWRNLLMVFITLGSQKFQFNRLLMAMDRLMEEGKIRDEVFAQVGYSDYQPKYYPYRQFLNSEEYDQLLLSADVIISHAGTGIITKAVKKGKRVIAVPRLACFGEHVDDHQLQIVEMFNCLGYICACQECDQLAEKVAEVKKMKIQPYKSNTDKIIGSLEDYISRLP